MKTMAEVLAKHQWYDATSDNEDPATGCTGCPEWFGSEDALDDGTFAAHQAIELANAGYGDVRAATAGAFRDAAERFRQRSDTLHNTMQEMTASREYGLEDIVRHGAYAAEANTTAAWFRTQAAKAATR